MNPVQDPVTARQPNPGTFMAAPAGGQNGNGSALLQLLRLQAISGKGPNMVANPTNPQGIQMSQPPQDQGGLPSFSQGSVGNSATVAPTTSPNVQGGIQPGGAVQTDDNLQLAMTALKNYIDGHTEVLKAKHGVNESKARASLISAQARPQGGQ